MSTSGRKQPTQASMSLASTAIAYRMASCWMARCASMRSTRSASPGSGTSSLRSGVRVWTDRLAFRIISQLIVSYDWPARAERVQPLLPGSARRHIGAPGSLRRQGAGAPGGHHGRRRHGGDLYAELEANWHLTAEEA